MPYKLLHRYYYTYIYLSQGQTI